MHLYPKKKKLALTAQEFEDILGSVQYSAHSGCDEGQDFDRLQALWRNLQEHAPRFRELAELQVPPEAI